MLLLAFVSGFIWDADALVYDYTNSQGGESFSSSLGLPFGYSILLFGLLGMFMQGIRPKFKDGKLGFPIILVGLCIGVWRILEYLLLIFRRGAPAFNHGYWTELVGCIFLSLAVTPIIMFLLHKVARSLSYKIRYEGVRFYGH